MASSNNTTSTATTRLGSSSSRPAYTPQAAAPRARPTSGYQPMLRHRSAGLTSPSIGSGKPVRKVTASVSCRIIGPASLLVRATASPCFSAPELGVGLAGVAGDAGALEGRHLAEDAGGGLDDAHRQSRPSALAEPHLQVEQRHQAELVEHQLVLDELGL